MHENPLRSHSRTDAGLVHPRNEDQYAVFDTPDGGRVLLVCDGMGGMGRGDEASHLAMEALRQSLQEEAADDATDRPTERLARAVRSADETVRNALYVAGQAAQPGSTAVLVYVAEGEASVCWVGDSRAYLVRDGAVIARTRDHKLVEDLVEAGQMTPADARNSSLAHVVTRAIGGKSPDEPGVTPQALPATWRLRNGDRILLCSDGLTDLVDDEELPPILEASDLAAVSRRLVDLANERGGHDNITCVVAVWDGPDAARETEDLYPPELTDPSADSHRTYPPPDVAAIARELLPWWIATGVLLAGAVGAAVFAALQAAR